MPLSRLSPRSSQTAPARQRATHRKRSDAQRHLHLWAAIRKTQEELEQWQRQIDQVDGLFGKHIVPRERQLTAVVSNITEQLIKHFADGMLAIPDQSLLGLWVTDNLNALRDHPFGDSQRTSTLRHAWLKLLNNDGAIENQLARLARQHNPGVDNNPQAHPEDTGVDDSAYVDDDELFDFGMHKKETKEASSQTYGQSGAPNETASSDSEEEVDDNKASSTHSDSKHNDSQPGQASVADTIHSLEDKLSVERLFRQLARVLHPDREQDETAKAAKNILMSECLKARQENDITTLLSLYCEHVGELPDDLNNNSHNELVKALELQLKQLQIELRQKRFGDPLQTMIVERYSSSSSADCERRILQHASSLDAEILSGQQTVDKLSEPDGLMDALDARRAIEQDKMAINEMTGF